MSIWCSWEHIGSDPVFTERVAVRGNVLSFAAGFSNHYPDPTGDCERDAVLGVAHIPVWCVPGHDEETDDEVGPWLRLEVSAPETVNFWEKDAGGNPVMEDEGATVVLDEDAVRALVDDLRAWLKRPKVYPVAESSETV